jgi:hypothetical protein
MSKSPKKRALAEGASTELALESSNKRLRPLESIYQAHFQSQVQDLQAALEHERSLRSLDQRRFQQTQARLERQVEFAVQEAQETKSLLEEARLESDQHIQQVRDARAEALRQLRECQEQLAQVELEETVDGHDKRLAQEREALLKQELELKMEEIQALRERLNTVTREQLDSLEAKKKGSPDSKQPDSNDGAMSPAPKEVLRELNRVRIELAESERKYRQLRRKSDEWQQKANLYVQEREANRSATARVHQVEQEVRELRKEYEAARASNESWNDFGKKLTALIMDEPYARNGPPEIATVVRHLEKQKLNTQKLADDKAALQKSLDTCNERIIALTSLHKDDSVIITKATAVKNELQSKLDGANQQIQTLKAQEGIWRRETDSLRSLLKTFDELPVSGAEKSSNTNSVTGQSLQISLDTAKEEIRVLTSERDRLTTEIKTLRDEQDEQQKEHARVVEKFGKLREALTAEKVKVEESEARACKAEALAGKGSFSMEETRVLHLQRNPLSEAIREHYETEIRGLQRKLEEATGQKPARGASASEVDPHKLHQRLKQSFKEQIALFREGVYLMTGYKVDMLQQDKTMFRVRSVYAEQEQDHLMFVCQKDGEEVTSLDLVETDLAKLLSTTDSYQYMTKFNSLPGFLASVQLSLFEKQTFIASS